MVEIDAKAGDLIKLRLAREELECTLLESYDSNVLLVKLKSGYNIGVPKENVFGCEVVRKFDDKKEKIKNNRENRKEIDRKSGDKKEKIGLVITGGTIASKLDYRTGGASALTNVEEFKRFYPYLFEEDFEADIEIKVPFMKLSENMNSEDWIKIAQVVKGLVDDKDIRGVIVAHGTDSLHYTSSALSFFLRHLSKPVVLTYAQRSIDRASSDADLNLRCAARFALSDCAGVYVVGHADLNDDFCYALLGTKVRKMHTSRRDAFKPINTRAVAKVWPDKLEFLSNFRARSDNNVELDAVFNDKVALLKFYPGQSADIVDYYRMHGYKGLVVEVLGLGGLPSGENHSWILALKKAIREGMIVCASAQTIYGRLNARVYSGGREFEKIGVIFLEDMLSETAFVKLGWILGHRGFKDREKAREKMLTNIAGEFNELLSE